MTAITSDGGATLLVPALPSAAEPAEPSHPDAGVLHATLECSTLSRPLAGRTQDLPGTPSPRVAKSLPGQ